MILIGYGVCLLLFVVVLAFLQINSNFLNFFNFRFEMWQTLPAPQCATILDSAIGLPGIDQNPQDWT
jgi:hypothetical protein